MQELMFFSYFSADSGRSVYLTEKKHYADCYCRPHRSCYAADSWREFAITLYAQEKLTLGSVAELAEMPQFEFQLIAGGRGISPHYDLADFEEDYALLQRRGVV